jgi:hypothetical protein
MRLGEKFVISFRIGGFYNGEKRINIHMSVGNEVKDTFYSWGKKLLLSVILPSVRV